MARGRPPLNPTIRWEKELDIWYSAEGRREMVPQGAPLLVMRMASKSKAVQMCHRLNSARAQTRPIGPDGYPTMHPDWDQMAVHVYDDPPRIEIAYKQGFDWSNVTDGAGNPITQADADRYRMRRRFGDTMPTDAEMAERVARIQRERDRSALGQNKQDAPRSKPPHDPSDPSFLDTLGEPDGDT